MAQKYIDQANVGSGWNRTSSGNICQLSDGTAVWGEADLNDHAFLLWSADHSTVNTLQTFAFPTWHGSSLSVAVDSSDNIYVGEATASGLLVQAFTKGAGHTWTAQASFTIAGTFYTNTASWHYLVWCSTGGGTNNKGHLFWVGVDGTTNSSYAIVDAGVLLLGTGTPLTASGTNPAFLSPFATVVISPNGFGAANGLVMTGASGTGVLIRIGSWAVSSSGTLTTGVSVGTITTGGAVGGNYCIGALVNYKAGNWVAIYNSTTTSGHSMAAICTTGSINAGVDSGAPTNWPLAAALFNPVIYADPGVANQIWVVFPALTVASNNLPLYRLQVALGTGTPVWGGSVTAVGTWTGVLNGSYNTGPNLLGIGASSSVPRGATVDIQWGGIQQSGGAWSLYGDYINMAAAPSAPTLTFPANGAFVDVSSGFGPQATYNSTDGANQNAYAFRIKLAAGSYNYWNAGTSSLQSTIVWNADSVATGSSFSTSISSGLTNANTYNWSYASQESLSSLQGPFATDFVLNAQAGPSCVVNAPSGTTASSIPVVTWTTTPAAGDVQTNYRVIIYTQAAYTGGGFTPGTTVGTWDSTNLSGSVQSLQVGTPLTNGTTYRAYVQVTQTGGQVSGWVFSTFTVSFDGPATPTISAAATTDPITQCPMIQITVTGHDNYLSANDSSFEGGLGTWTATTNCAITQTTNAQDDGSFAMQMSSTAAGTMSAGTATGSGGYVVQPSTSYTAQAAFKTAVSARSANIAIAWYTSAGALISTSTGSNVTDAVGSWTVASVIATSPVNAAFARIVATVVSTAAAAEIHYADNVGLFLGNVVPAWSLGGFLGATAIQIVRSDGLYVRGASLANPAAVANTATQQVVVNDYEAIPTVAYTYSAAVVYTTSNLVSPIVTSSAVTLTTTQWWELDPTNPSSAINAQFIAFSPMVTEQSTARLVMGQATPNIVANAMGANDGIGTFEIFTAAIYTGIQALLTGQKTVFLSDPWGNTYGSNGPYIRFGPQTGGMSSGLGNKTKDATLLPSTAAAPHRTINVTWVAQQRPAV